MKVYRVSAFTDHLPGGNPAGVVFESRGFSHKEMLAIAAEVGYSETVFVMPSDKADYRLRFFTPVDEVDLCGHGTIASLNLMRDLGMISLGSYTQETLAGILKLDVYEDRVMMAQTLPYYGEVITTEAIKQCFEQDCHQWLDENLPVQVVSTGLKDIIVPVNNLESLQALTLDSEAVCDLSRKFEVTGIHAFTTETIDGNNAHARNFAPLYGIEEEAATGTASGALAAYMYRHCPEVVKASMVFEQGDGMGRPSRISVSLEQKEGGLTNVLVGGSAVLMK